MSEMWWQLTRQTYINYSALSFKSCHNELELLNNSTRSKRQEKTERPSQACFQQARRPTTGDCNHSVVKKELLTGNNKRVISKDKLNDVTVITFSLNISVI